MKENEVYPDICALCFREGKLFKPNCNERPELLIGQPIGMYHCPCCGAIVLAGCPHPYLCENCNPKI